MSSQPAQNRWKVFLRAVVCTLLLIGLLAPSPFTNNVVAQNNAGLTDQELAKLKKEVIGPDEAGYGLIIYLEEVRLSLTFGWRRKIKLLNEQIAMHDKEEILMHAKYGLFSKEFDRVSKIRMEKEYAIIQLVKENRPDIYQNYQDVLTNQLGRDRDFEKALREAPIKGQLEAKIDDLRAKLTAAHEGGDVQKMSDAFAELEKAKAEYLNLINRLDNYEMMFDDVGQKIEDFFTGVNDPFRTSMIEKRANAEREYAKKVGDDEDVKIIDELIIQAKQAVSEAKDKAAADAKVKAMNEVLVKLQKALTDTGRKIRKTAADTAATKEAADQVLGVPEVKNTLNSIPSTTNNGSTLELWGWKNLEGYVGAAFERTFLAKAGLAPYHFQLESGVGFPPHGIILDTNGRLSGTPTIAGTSKFGVCAVDSAGSSKCGKVTFVITDAGGGQNGGQTENEASAIAITSASCYMSKAGNPYDAEYTFNISGTASGPVGANVNMPGLSGYITTTYSNTSWGDHSSRWPIRGAGESANTTWTATLVVGGNNGGTSRQIDTYVFADGTQAAQDSRQVSC